ncbi:MAG: hypothetical protein I8H71_00850 [Xanthomonadaceae bacterium]|nr:hypothetical protein [Xanthomonadaceae bacterium]
MRQLDLAALAVVSLAGCASFDRDAMAQFTMLTASEWQMSVQTAANYKPDSADAERTRMGWIDQFASVNGCQAPVVVGRIWTKAPDNFMRTGFSDSVGRLLYRGTCGRG